METCHKCGEKLNAEGDYITCYGGCRNSYHYECSSVTKDAWKKSKIEIRKKHKCDECKNPTPKTTSEDDSELAKMAISMKDMLDKMDKMEKRLRGDVMQSKMDLQTELQGVIESITFTNRKYEEIKNENIEMKEEIKTLKQKVEALEKNDVKANKLEEEMKSLKTAQHEQEQYARNKNIEIVGVEQTPNEDTVEVVSKIASLLKISDFSSVQIEKCHRVPARNPAKVNPIIVQFKTRIDRDEWLISKRRQHLKNSQIVESANEANVYVNGHLTQHFKTLLWKTKQHAKQNGYKYVWFRNCRINMKKDENEKEVKVIRCEEDLK